jgi:hypothetical protein
MEALIIAFWMFLAGVSPEGIIVVPNSDETEIQDFTIEPLSAGGNVKSADIDGI